MQAVPAVATGGRDTEVTRQDPRGDTDIRPALGDAVVVKVEGDLLAGIVCEVFEHDPHGAAVRVSDTGTCEPLVWTTRVLADRCYRVVGDRAIARVYADARAAARAATARLRADRDQLARSIHGYRDSHRQAADADFRSREAIRLALDELRAAPRRATALCIADAETTLANLLDGRPLAAARPALTSGTKGGQA